MVQSIYSILCIVYRQTSKHRNSLRKIFFEEKKWEAKKKFAFTFFDRLHSVHVETKEKDIVLRFELVYLNNFQSFNVSYFIWTVPFTHYIQKCIDSNLLTLPYAKVSIKVTSIFVFFFRLMLPGLIIIIVIAGWISCNKNPFFCLLLKYTSFCNIVQR